MKYTGIPLSVLAARMSAVSIRAGPIGTRTNSPVSLMPNSWLRMALYLGRIIRTSWRFCRSSFGRAPTTSAKPPVLQKGTHSEATKRIFRLFGLAKELGGFFGRRRVDVETRPPFKTCHFRQFRHDL